MKRRVLVLFFLIGVGASACVGRASERGDGGVCATDEDCASLGQYCDIPTSLCEACTTNAQCSLEATLPTCDVATKACRACATNEDCVGAVGGALCDVDSGQCVQCFTDASCGSGTCDVTTNRCTTVAPGSVVGCGLCASNTQCPNEFVCVRDDFQGTPLDFVCMPRAKANGPNGRCSAEYATLRPFARLHSATPIAANEMVEICAPIVATTCDALRDLRNSCISDDECGSVGLSDGWCTTIEGAQRCSAECGALHHCPDGSTCTTSLPNDSTLRCR